MFSCLLIVIFTVFVVYPLSIGPAVVVHDRAESATVKQVIEFFYRPLLFASERIPVVGEFVFSYAGYWEFDD